MENRNGYFMPVIKGQLLYLRFFPPQEGGEVLEIKEIMQYLSEEGYTEYDIRDLNHAIHSDVPETVMIGNDMGNPFHEKITINVSLDHMLVWCRFYPPASTGRALTREDIYDALQHEKIVYGINEEKLDELLAQREYCTEYLIGKGTPPTLGKDGKIEYFFSTDQSLKPKHNEDGSVNYHELNIISKVTKDQLIAKLIPPVPGNPGKNLLGEELKPRDVQTPKLLYANNIRISEDGTELYSELTGHASLVQGKVFVSGVYEVPADVDNSIGDIDYPGNVSVKGNVKSGFVIHADGDIVVEGVVEGAKLYAGGQIIVQCGIHGMEKGVLEAGGNVVIKFIEGATVRAGGYIETESIIQSKVSSNTEINVSGGKGFIMGGEVRASHKVSANMIGSTMGTYTSVEVGVEPEKQEYYAKLQQDAKTIAKQIEHIRPILINYRNKMQSGVPISKEKMEFMKQQVTELKSLQEQLGPINEQINTLRTEFIGSSHAKVVVQKVIYPGVTIKISDLSVTTKEARKFCQFLLRDGEIRADNL